MVTIVKQSPPAVQNEIRVGFAEAHMFPRPDSLAEELAEALGHRRIGDVFKAASRIRRKPGRRRPLASPAIAHSTSLPIAP